MDKAPLEVYDMNLTYTHNTLCIQSSLNERLGKCGKKEGDKDRLQGNTYNLYQVDEATC